MSDIDAATLTYTTLRRRGLDHEQRRARAAVTLMADRLGALDDLPDILGALGLIDMPTKPGTRRGYVPCERCGGLRTRHAALCVSCSKRERRGL